MYDNIVDIAFIDKEFKELLNGVKGNGNERLYSLQEIVLQNKKVSQEKHNYSSKQELDFTYFCALYNIFLKKSSNRFFILSQTGSSLPKKLQVCCLSNSLFVAYGTDSSLPIELCIRCNETFIV